MTCREENCEREALPGRPWCRFCVHDIEPAEKLGILTERLAQFLARDDMYGNASGDWHDYVDDAKGYLDALGVPELVDTVSFPYWDTAHTDGREGFYDKLAKVLHHVEHRIGGEGFGEPGVERYWQASCWCGWSFRDADMDLSDRMGIEHMAVNG